MKKYIFKQFLLTVLGSLCLFIFPQTLTAVNSNIQVVTTIPVETDLAVEGAKDATTTWVEMIDGAQSSLDFAQFYLSSAENEPLEPVIEAILKAAQRGVKVRFLVGKAVNKSMAERTDEVKKRFRKIKNIKVEDFDWKPVTGGIIHAKYFIVDKKEIYVGSQNFDWRSLKHIHETGLRIKSEESARILGAIFEVDWKFNKGNRAAYAKAKRGEPLFQGKDTFIVASPFAQTPRGIPDALDTLIGLINNAKKQITIQLLDYHTEIYKSEKKFTVIDEALRKAASRGVQVKLLVADWNKRKPGVNGLKELVKVPNIEVKFATIPVYSKGFIPYARVIHSKVMRIDDVISWVGTSNWGDRYFYQSRNIEVVTHEPEVAKILTQLFQRLWDSPYTYPVEPDKEYEPPKISG